MADGCHSGLGEKDEARNVKLNQILILRFLRSVKPFLKKKSTIPYIDTYSGQVEMEDEEELNSDPDSVNEDEAPAQTPKTSTGSVLITLFTSKPYSLWSLP